MLWVVVVFIFFNVFFLGFVDKDFYIWFLVWIVIVVVFYFFYGVYFMYDVEVQMLLDFLMKEGLEYFEKFMD